MNPNKILENRKPQLIENPFNPSQKIAFLTSKKNYYDELKFLNLDPNHYEDPIHDNVFYFGNRDIPYLLLDTKKQTAFSFLLNKLSKETVFSKNERTWTLYHELAHGSSFQLDDEDYINRLHHYYDKYGRSNTNIGLKRETHSDLCSLLAMTHHLSKEDFSVFSKELINYRLSGDSEEHNTGLALTVISSHSDTLWETFNRATFDEINQFSQVITDQYIQHDFGLLKEESFPYNMRRSFKFSGQREEKTKEFIRFFDSIIDNIEHKKKAKNKFSPS